MYVAQHPGEARQLEFLREAERRRHARSLRSQRSETHRPLRLRVGRLLVAAGERLKEDYEYSSGHAAGDRLALSG